MAEGSRGGHFKLVLALVLIAGILGLVAYANTGQKFLEAFKIGKFTNVQPDAQAEPFGILLSTGVTALYGKSFSIAGSPFSFEGVCNLITLGGVTATSDETRCSVSVDSFVGTFQYTQFGSILFVGSAPAVKVDTKKYSTATPINFEFEVIPTGFSVVGINEKQVTLSVPSGRIERYSSDGSLRGTESLNQSIDLNNLIANAELKNGELKVTGTATSVRSEEFSW